MTLVKKIIVAATSFFSVALGTIWILRWRKRRAQSAADAAKLKQIEAEKSALDNIIALLLQEKREEAIKQAQQYADNENPRSFYTHLLLCQLAQDKNEQFEKLDKLRETATSDQEQRLVEILLMQLQEPTKIIRFDGVPENVFAWLFLCLQQIIINDQMTSAHKDLISGWANRVIKAQEATDVQISYAWTLVASVSETPQAALGCHALAIGKYDKNVLSLTQKATQSKLADAVGLLERALTINPNSLKARIVQSDIYIQQQKWSEAEAILKSGIAIAGESHQAINLHGALIRVYQLQNKYKEVVEFAQENMKKSDDYQTFFAMASILYNLAQLKLDVVDNEIDTLSKEAKQVPQTAAVISRYAAYADAFKKLFAKEPRLKEALTGSQPPYNGLLEQMEPTLSSIVYPFDGSKESIKEVFSLVRAMLMLNAIGTPVIGTFYDFEEVLHKIIVDQPHLLDVCSNAFICYLLLKDLVQKKRRSKLFDAAFLSALKSAAAEAKTSKDNAALLIEDIKKLL